MAADTRIETVRIADLLRDERFQVRAKLDPRTIHRYASVYRSGNEMPPVRVAVVNGALVVVDGWHRLAALESLGKHEASAEIIEATESEALWLAAQANLGHGLPLKSGEVRTAFRAYIKAKRHRDGRELKSYRHIAQDLGGLKAYTTIRHWMRKDFPRIAAQMAGEELKGDGGLPDIEPNAPFEDAVRTALQNAMAAFRGVSDAKTRGNLIEAAEELVRDMKRLGPWEPWEPEFCVRDELFNMNGPNNAQRANYLF